MNLKQAIESHQLQQAQFVQNVTRLMQEVPELADRLVCLIAPTRDRLGEIVFYPKRWYDGNFVGKDRFQELFAENEISTDETGNWTTLVGDLRVTLYQAARIEEVANV